MVRLAPRQINTATVNAGLRAADARASKTRKAPFAPQPQANERRGKVQFPFDFLGAS